MKDKNWNYEENKNILDFDNYLPVIVYASEPHFGKLDPKFKKIKKKLQVICNSNKHELLRFSIKKHDPDNASNHKVYGSFTCTASYISENKQDYPIFDKKNK